MSGGECFPIKECDDEKTSELECVVCSAKRTIGSLQIAFRTCRRVFLSKPSFTWPHVRYPIGQFSTLGRAEWRETDHGEGVVPMGVWWSDIV